MTISLALIALLSENWRRYLGSMPITLMRFLILVVSASSSWAAWPGVVPVTSTPAASMRSFVSALPSTRTISRLSRSTMGDGVFAGADIVVIFDHSYPGNSDAIVGSSGARADDVLLVIASALSLPS